MASMPMSPLTEEQYLHLECEAETKSEFHDGQMFAMAGGSLNHSLLATRMGTLLDRQMPLGCRAFNSDCESRSLRPGFSPTRIAVCFVANPNSSGTGAILFSILC